MRRKIALLLALVMSVVTLGSCGAKQKQETGQIKGWTKDSPAMASIVSYVQSVTDEKSPDYLPPEKRICCFATTWSATTAFLKKQRRSGGLRRARL